tara:strand:- start:150 stop:569 length:420 start_codon:yes stop_codon:yes gene_type:complete
MAQITDMGGQDYGNKIKMEQDAKNAGVSLGLQGQGGQPDPVPPVPTPQRSTPTNLNPKPLNIGRGSDFILNGPPKGNNPLTGLGQSARLLSDDALAYKDSVSKARDLMENSTIPLVRQQAAEYIKNAAYLRSVQRAELE